MNVITIEMRCAEVNFFSYYNSKREWLFGHFRRFFLLTLFFSVCNTYSSIIVSERLEFFFSSKSISKVQNGSGAYRASDQNFVLLFLVCSVRHNYSKPKTKPLL